MIKIDNVGNRLKELRKEKNMTQRQLSIIFNVSQESISSYERNKSNPSFDILCMYADQFDVSVDYILGRTNNKLFIKMGDLNPFEEYFVTTYRSVSVRGKNMMAKIVKALSDADIENKKLFP